MTRNTIEALKASSARAATEAELVSINPAMLALIEEVQLGFGFSSMSQTLTYALCAAQAIAENGGKFYVIRQGEFQCVTINVDDPGDD